ncbi:MAG TPA: sulfite exporter TauE/SafE family protein [Candidatus Paceibacterota bacterium]|nr:sulfite exporter TauE/SafE family protein [Candidatus Paceibacterota bacterium]
MKTYSLNVSGMHCSACEALIEGELFEAKGIRAKASLAKGTVEIEGDFAGEAPDKLAARLTDVISPFGYSLSVAKPVHTIAWGDFTIAVPIALAFILVFIGLQKIGIVNLVSITSVSYGTAFVVGLIASISTCMAIVGGLVLSMSASFAKEGDTVKPQMLFHVGRLVSFFVLGGVIGALGSVFRLGTGSTLVVGIIVALVLFILGVNLLDVFPWMKRLTPALPSFMSKRVEKLKGANHTLTPLLVGIVTFFLPCGFTQSMQVYALSTGSFFTGAFTMFSFALGTLPVLSLLSFGSARLHGAARSGAFFKAAGIVVIFFALINLATSLAAAGIMPPLVNF